MASTNVYIPKSGTVQKIDNSAFNVKFNQTVEELNAGLTKSQRTLKLTYDANLRLNDSMGRCVEGLSIWQLKLGMWIDELGKARTIAGGYADGLSKTELELGFYADALGEVHDIQGNVIRKTKAAISAENEQREAMQRTREAFADAFDALGDGAGRLSSLLSSFESLSGGADEFRNKVVRIAGTFDAASQAFSTIQNFGTWFKEAKTSALAFNAALKTSETTVGGLKAAIAAIGGPLTLIAGAIAAATAAFVVFNATAKEADEPNDEMNDLAESFEKIKRRAKEAGDEIKTLADVLKYGAMNKDDDSLGAYEAKIQAEEKKLESLREQQKKAQEAVAEAAKSSGMNSAGAVRTAQKEVDRIVGETNKTKAEIESLEAQYNEVAQDLIKQMREEQITEEDKTKALKEQYRNLLKYAQTDEDRAAIEKKIKSLDDEIAEAKKATLDKQREELEKSLGISLDFTESPTKTQEELFNEEKAKLDALYQEDGSGFIKSKEDLNKAIERLQQKYSDAASADLSDSLGAVTSSDDLERFRDSLEDSRSKGLILSDQYNELLKQTNAKEKELLDAKIDAIPGLKGLLEANDAAKNAVEMNAKAVEYASKYLESDPFDNGDVFSDDRLKLLQDDPNGILNDAAAEYASAMEAAEKALEENLIDNETYNELVNRANENLAKATDDAAENLRKQAEQERDKARSELGIDAIMESLKTPAQKYAEQLKKAKDALEKGQIDEKEFAAFKAKLDDDEAERAKKLGDSEDKFKNELDQKKPEGKDEPKKSMEGGSSDLYLALVKNSTANYQSKMQATTERMYGIQAEALDESRQMNYYLSQMLSGDAYETPVWG